MHKIVLIHFGKLNGLVRGNIYNNLTHEARKWLEKFIIPPCIVGKAVMSQPHITGRTDPHLLSDDAQVIFRGGVDPYLISSWEIQNDTIFLNDQIQISFQDGRWINTLRGQI